MMDRLSRGTIFRFPTHDVSYGEYVDLMLFLPEDGGLGMIITAGPKAGHVLTRLPQEALTPGTRMLSLAWLEENWEKWVWPECSYEEVAILDRYPTPGPSSE
ncbi:Imm45 family immunity protein [Devosia sp.]|uniref:Imm45 family immunity protein n=1 Tax=Devosia sp. TaxID=1871048 RepID=UPI003F70A84D